MVDTPSAGPSKEIQAITHTGTHVDAPYHYGPTSEGKPARRIDELPLNGSWRPRGY